MSDNEHQSFPPPLGAPLQPLDSPPNGPPPPFATQHAPQQTPPSFVPYGFGPVKQTNGLATASMVVGIVGLASIFFCYGLLGIAAGPAAFFMGRSAQRTMSESPDSWQNPAMAKIGWILGLIQTILAIVVIVASAAFFIWFLSSGDEFLPDQN